MSVEVCPLKNLNLPPIGEVEHSVHLCYCHLCTCALHKCPGEQRHVLRSSKSQFKTNYKLNYRKLVVSPTIKKPHVSNESYIPKFKANWTSTMKQDFIAQEMTRSPTLKRIRTDSLNLKLTGRTMYQAEFPNWGPLHIEKHQPFSPNMHSPPLKNSTTYKAFDTLEEQFSPPKTCKFESNYFRKKDWFGESHSKSAFRDNGKSFPKHEKAPVNQIPKMNTWSAQYSTSYKDFFKGSQRKNMPKRRNAN